MHSVIENQAHDPSALSKFKKFLTGGAAGRAVHAGQGGHLQKARDDSDFAVTKKVGKHGRYMCRIINYIRLGPFQRQTETRWLHGEGWPVMQTYYVHRFLHATKGWREYVGGLAMKVPVHMDLPQYPRRFFGPNHRYATNY